KSRRMGITHTAGGRPMGSADFKYLDIELAQEKRYWLEHLSGDLPVAGIPLDFRRPPIFAGRDATVELHVTPELEDKLSLLWRDNDSLTFTLLAAALKVLLHKYTGLEEIVIGAAIHEKYAGVAAFNKTLALRTRVDGASTLRRFLDEARRA